MMVLCCVNAKFFLSGREKEDEGEDFYGVSVPELSVENVLRVAHTTCFLRLIPAVRIDFFSIDRVTCAVS
jgi:hypothetical protein